MTSTLTRRIEQMEQSFGPTEAAARWLVEAKGYGSMAAYQAAFTTGEVPIPLVELPRLVTAWVKRNAQGETERAITQKTARAVRAVMTRVCLVDWMNSQIDWEKHVDEFAADAPVYLINYQITLPAARREMAGAEWMPRTARYSN